MRESETRESQSAVPIIDCAAFARSCEENSLSVGRSTYDNKGGWGGGGVRGSLETHTHTHTG